MQDRKEQEKLFHNKLRDSSFAQRWSPELEELIKRDPMWVNMKYYSIERRSRNFVLNWLSRNCQGKNVLDYCCGNGEDAIFIAKNGARKVMGIDISDVSIDNCRVRADNDKIADVASFQIMDAENLKFEDNVFDIITEYGCLHHIDLERAFCEMARVLKPEGKVICNEALGHNLIIRLYRELTPNLRTAFEAKHILKKKDIELARKYFGKIEYQFFHLFTLPLVVFRNTPWFNASLTLMESLDSVVLRLPVVKWQAWQVVFVLSDPKK